MDKYESVLMVASGFGIAALLPYIKKLIHGYNTRVGRARQIHVVWQISARGRFIISESTSQLTVAADGLPVQEMLNRALEEDKLDNGCVCGNLPPFGAIANANAG
jgi:NAD(P)H-flavin reductase